MRAAGVQVGRRASDTERRFYMKFIVGVVNMDDIRSLVDVLLTVGYHVTTLKTAGGFLRKEDATLFTCVDHEQM